MSSISVGELKHILDKYPDATKYDIEAGTSIDFINGIEVNDEFKEIKLMN
nr:hypothetical protein [Coprococcus catus]